MSMPRRHHYIPVNYLKGFTPSGDSTDRLHVIDLLRATSRQCRPGATGFENDFYKIERDGINPNAVEYAFGKVENLVAPSLQRVRLQRSMNTEELEDLLTFISVQSIRGFAFQRIVREA